MTTSQEDKGFSLVELIVVIAIIGILAAVAVPQYGQYMKSSKFMSEVAAQTAPYKTAVSVCIQLTSSINGCNAGTNRIPPVPPSAVGAFQGLTVVNGVITASATAELDFSQYVLTPLYDPTTDTLDWNMSGSCVVYGFCGD